MQYLQWDYYTLNLDNLTILSFCQSFSMDVVIRNYWYLSN